MAYEAGLGSGIRNPVAECPVCFRVMTTNLIGRHVRGHDPAWQEDQRLRKNAHMVGYSREKRRLAGAKPKRPGQTREERNAYARAWRQRHLAEVRQDEWLRKRAECVDCGGLRNAKGRARCRPCDLVLRASARARCACGTATLARECISCVRVRQREARDLRTAEALDRAVKREAKRAAERPFREASERARNRERMAKRQSAGLNAIWLAGDSIYVSSLPQEWQPVALAIREARQLIREKGAHRGAEV